MGQKYQYMIWREKNGFFSALDQHSHLDTWSLLSGKMLYSEKQSGDSAKENIQDYEVYMADENDITYTRDFYNQEDCSLSLLKSKETADLSLFLR